MAEERASDAEQRVLHVEFFGLLNLLPDIRFALLFDLHLLLGEL